MSYYPHSILCGTIDGYKEIIFFHSTLSTSQGTKLFEL